MLHHLEKAKQNPGISIYLEKSKNYKYCHSIVLFDSVS